MKVRNFSDIKALFFHNRTARQTIFKNTFWLGFSSGVSRVMTFFLFIYVARIFGPNQYGQFNFALSFVLLFGTLFDFGVSRIIVREFAQNQENEKEFSSLISLKLLLSSVALSIIFFGSFFITHDPLIRTLIWILGVYIAIGNFFNIFYSFLQARQKMEYEGAAKILETVIYVSFGFLVIFSFPSVKNLAFGYLASILFFSVFFLVFFHFRIHPLRFSWNKSVWKRYLLLSWPLALTALFSSIYNQTDTIMLGAFGQITQTGWYQAAYRVVAATLIPATIISTSFFPMLNRSFKETKAGFQRIWNYHIDLMISLAVPLVVGGIILAPKIIEFVFNPSFSPSVLAFQILIVTTGLVALQIPFYHALIASNQQKKIFFVVLAGAIINVILNWIFIPKFSLYGAAAVTVATWFIVISAMMLFTRISTSIRPFNSKVLLSFSRSFLSVIPMYFVITEPRVYNINVILTVLFGAAVYFIFLFIFKKGIKLSRP